MSFKKYSGIKINLKIKKTKTGLGLFATEIIPKGEFIIEYTGPVLNRKEANEKGGKYLFETSYNRFIDGSSRKNLARYINHSCFPNCEIEIIKGHIIVFSKKNILPGQELSYDYDKEYFDEFIKPYGCRCLKCITKK